MNNKLASLRENYKSLNKRGFNQRLGMSNPIERWILDTINHHGVDWQGVKLNNWEKCSFKLDTELKRDAQAVVGDVTYYSQIKYRQPNSGSDIGCAIIQPYPGSLAKLKAIAKNKKDFEKVFARDYKFDGIIYAVLNNAWEKLMVLPYEIIKPAYQKVFKEWWQNQDGIDLNNYSRVFYSRKLSGAQLRWKLDKGVEKIICYLPISIFKNDKRVQIFDMIDLPDYLFQKD